jgi:hypothetical protein
VPANDTVFGSPSPEEIPSDLQQCTP